MKLISEIIDLLGDSSSTTQSALMKAQILAHKLKHPELGAWVGSELRGYSVDSDVPNYRRLRTTVLGRVTNGYHVHNNMVLPVNGLPDRIKENFTTQNVRESIATIEGWGTKDGLSIPVTPELYPLLSKKFSHGYFVESARLVFGEGALAQVLVEVRSRLLEFCLKISDDIPEEADSQELPSLAKSIGSNDIFKHVVFGDNATIVVQGGSINNVSNTITTGDFSALSDSLIKAGVDASDIKDLDDAIKADDGAVVEKSKFGPRVSKWIGSMVVKASTGAWNVGVGAAGSLLATALSKYYGV